MNFIKKMYFLYYILKLKKFIIKLITFWIPKKQRKTVRNFLFWFSFADFIKFKKQNFCIVSLGGNCLPRTLTTAIKLKPRKFYGEKSCPFDLFVNNDLNKISEFINNDFETFFDRIKINQKNFPHDFKLSPANFKKRYENRIKNFLEIMQSEKMVYFIHFDHNKTSDADKVSRLYNTLLKKRKNKPFKLIILNSSRINVPDDIVQITESFDITDSEWVEYMINEYKNYNNKYTDYCKKMHKILSKVIVNCL